MPQLARADILITVQRDEVAGRQQVGPAGALPPVLERHVTSDIRWRQGHIGTVGDPQLVELVAYALVVHAKLGKSAHANALRLHMLHLLDKLAGLKYREIDRRGP